MLACLQCDTKFQSQSSLSRHVSSRHGAGINQPKCPECHKTFSRRDVMERHIRIHKGGGTETCPSCFQPISRKDYLKQHQKSCHQKSALYSRAALWDLSSSSAAPQTWHEPSRPPTPRSFELDPTWSFDEHGESENVIAQHLSSSDTGTESFHISETLQSGAEYFPTEGNVFDSDTLQLSPFDSPVNGRHSTSAINYDELGRVNVDYWPSSNDVVVSFAF